METANANRLRSIHEETLSFFSDDAAGTAAMDRAQLRKELGNMLAVEELVLKVGAQVMLIKNIDDDLVNGSVGKIVGFHTEAEWGMVAREYDLDAVVTEVNPHTGEEKQIWSAAGKPIRNDKLKPSSQQSQMKFPAVKFNLASGGTRHRLIIRESFKIDGPDGTMKAERRQVRLSFFYGSFRMLIVLFCGLIRFH